MDGITAFFTYVALMAMSTAGWTVYRVATMQKKKKKKFVKKTLNSVFVRLEDAGILPRTPAFDRDYLETYPSLKQLEDAYEDIRVECLGLLDIHDRLTHMSAMGGSYTSRGIHTLKWKTFLLKSGDFVSENCARCPKTTTLLREIPELYTAFFSILEPKQYITPHWGYYKGFVRYHLGVVIPEDNRDRSCWIRVNASPEANAPRDLEEIARGEKYYWREGEGIVFDDNYLHDAANDSEEIRVVLWLDLRRDMPAYVGWFNRLCLWVIHRNKSIGEIRENGIVS